MLDEGMKQQIDSMSYEQLLEKWRNSPFGSPFFQGETGKYYSKVMTKKRKEIGNAAHVSASKAIGWK